MVTPVKRLTLVVNPRTFRRVNLGRTQVDGYLLVSKADERRDYFCVRLQVRSLRSRQSKAERSACQS